jgi:hypothetical protein
VKPGTVVARVYYAVPEHSGYGPEFDDWDKALHHARAKRADLITSLTQTLGDFSTPEEIQDTADIQVVVHLRWDMKFPDGGGIDTVMHTYRHVDRLRTTTDLARPPR